MGESEQIAVVDGYKAMVDFLDAFWKRGDSQSEDIAVLLSWMRLMPDGGSADPAMLEDWKDSVRRIVLQAEQPSHD